MAAALPAHGFIANGWPPPCQRAAPSPEDGRRRCERAASSPSSSTGQALAGSGLPSPSMAAAMARPASPPSDGRRPASARLIAFGWPPPCQRAAHHSPSCYGRRPRWRAVHRTLKFSHSSTVALQRAVRCTPVRDLPSGSSKQPPPPPFFLAIKHHFLAFAYSSLFSRLQKIGTNMVNKISSSWEGEEREREGDRETGTRVSRRALSNVSNHLWEPVREPRGQSPREKVKRGTGHRETCTKFETSIQGFYNPRLFYD